MSGACAERAEGRPVSAEDIKKRLNKTGSSEFAFETLDVHVPDGVFIPLGSKRGHIRPLFHRILVNSLPPRIPEFQYILRMCPLSQPVLDRAARYVHDLPDTDAKMRLMEGMGGIY